ncbi:MAG: cysteine--tRNA ligase [Campylobacterales bacterium]|nr:cysteine--tRNA ligase [Campylobacterales bacterium]
MRLFDSKTKTKREFTPQNPPRVTLYVCGPTVYDDAHLGHAKSALVFDLLARVLRASGYALTYAKNITDIDDKIINKALQTGESIGSLTTRYTEAYHRDMDALGVARPDIEPRATESIGAMLEMIDALIRSKHAYATPEGDVYFDTQSDPAYLSLSGRKQEQSETQSRVESSAHKKQSADFALWKTVKEGGNSFDSPYGAGRPGWHLECSAMIQKHLTCKGDTFGVDIHGGGADLLFPHHENEAAQTRCALGHELANFWVHNGFVTIDGEKMSKSLGNSFFLKDALNHYQGEVLRYYLLSVHYRSDFNFSEEDLLASKRRLDKLYRLKKRLFGLVTEQVKTPFQTELLEALGDDLNVSVAYALIDAMIQAANEGLDQNPKDKTLRSQILSNLAFIQTLLGFGAQNPFEYFQFGIDEATKMRIDALIEARNDAKKAKDFARSDALRDEIAALGIALMDTPQGTFWERKE